MEKLAAIYTFLFVQFVFKKIHKYDLRKIYFSDSDLLAQLCLSLKLMNVTAALIGPNRYEDKAAKLGMFGFLTVTNC